MGAVVTRDNAPAAPPAMTRSMGNRGSSFLEADPGPTASAILLPDPGRGRRNARAPLHVSQIGALASRFCGERRSPILVRLL